MLREPKLVRYPFGSYWWQEVNPHEYQIRRADPAQTIIGRLVEVPPHGRDKGKWILPDANQTYPESQSAIMGLELWDKLDKATTPAPANGHNPQGAAPVPPPPSVDTDGWLTVRQFAEQTGMPRSSVNARVQAGDLTGKKAVNPTTRQAFWLLAPPDQQDPAMLLKRRPASVPAASIPIPEPDSPPAPPVDTIDYLSTTEAAPLYGISRNELMNRLKSDQIPGAIKVPHGNRAGSRYRVPPPANLTFLAPPPVHAAPPIAVPEAPPTVPVVPTPTPTVDDHAALYQEIGRLHGRIEELSYDVAAIRALLTRPLPQPPPAPSFWQRLTGAPTNGRQEGGQP